MSKFTKSKSANPFRYFNSSPEVIRLVVMMYVRFPLSLRKRPHAGWAQLYAVGLSDEPMASS